MPLLDTYESDNDSDMSVEEGRNVPHTDTENLDGAADSTFASLDEPTSISSNTRKTHELLDDSFGDNGAHGDESGLGMYTDRVQSKKASRIIDAL